MWEETKTAAWAQVGLFAAAACKTPDIPLDKLDSVMERAAQFKAKNEAGAEKTTLTPEVTLPLVGLVEEVGPQRTRTKIVTLLSGWGALQAATQLGASVPVYALPDAAKEILLGAGVLHKTGVLLDRAFAVELLIQNNFTIAAELLADLSDPIEAEPPPPEPQPEETPQ